jgi:VanZ family protein
MSASSASRNRRRWLAWASVTVVWALLIFALSAQPNLRFLPDQGWDFVVRKAGHMAVFGLLAVFAWRTAVETNVVRRAAAWSLLVTILYAASDEVHQGFTAGRHPSPEDVGFDGVGAALGLLAAKWLAHRWSHS